MDFILTSLQETKTFNPSLPQLQTPLHPMPGSSVSGKKSHKGKNRNFWGSTAGMQSKLCEIHKTS